MSVYPIYFGQIFGIPFMLTGALGYFSKKSCNSVLRGCSCDHFSTIATASFVNIFSKHEQEICLLLLYWLIGQSLQIAVKQFPLLNFYILIIPIII